MPEGEEGVVGVFAICFVVVPVAVEGAFVGPQGVDEVEAGFFDFFDVGVKRGQGVQRRGGGEEVGDGGDGGGVEAAFGVVAGEEPAGERGVGRAAEVAGEGGGGGGGGGAAQGKVVVVGVGGAVGAEAVVAAVERGVGRAAEVAEEGGGGGGGGGEAHGKVVLVGVAAVVGAEAVDPAEDGGGVGEVGAEVLVGPEGEEAAVEGALLCARGDAV